MGYTLFSKYYDELTQNINYEDRARYFDAIIKKNCIEGNLLLDLACGTGSLSIELARLGYDVVGVDSSADMLSHAMQKKEQCDNDILFINQSMEDLELFSAVDVVVCALDSVNHITDYSKLCTAFEKISQYLNDDGLFIFDVNSKYKHECLLSNKTYIYDCESVYCVWQNSVSRDDVIDIELDFFENIGDETYKRGGEKFAERYYSGNEIKIALEKAGMHIVAIYSDDTMASPNENSQRLIYTARK